MQITDDYIRGLTDGEGCFTCCNVPTKSKTGNKLKIPTFLIAMHVRDRSLLVKVMDYLDLKGELYILKPSLKDGCKRGYSARFMVRNFGDLRDIIIPFFYKKLIGYKGIQFIEWLQKITSDSYVNPLFPHTRHFF